MGMNRSVLERMQNKYNDLAYDGNIGGEGSHFDLFSPMIRDMKMIGEDIAFTIRMREAGIPLWVDEGIKVMRVV